MVTAVCWHVLTRVFYLARSRVVWHIVNHDGANSAEESAPTTKEGDDMAQLTTCDDVTQPRQGEIPSPPARVVAEGACGRGALSPCHWDLTVEGESLADRTRRHVLGQAVCHSCVVRTECVQFASSLPEITGLWGGVIFGTLPPIRRHPRPAKRRRRVAARPAQTDPHYNLIPRKG